MFSLRWIEMCPWIEPSIDIGPLRSNKISIYSTYNTIKNPTYNYNQSKTTGPTPLEFMNKDIFLWEQRFLVMLCVILLELSRSFSSSLLVHSSICPCREKKKIWKFINSIKINSQILFLSNILINKKSTGHVMKDCAYCWYCLHISVCRRGACVWRMLSY